MICNQFINRFIITGKICLASKYSNVFARQSLKNFRFFSSMKDKSMNRANQRSNNIKYCKLTCEDIDQAANLTATAFTMNNALTAHLKISHNNMFVYVKDHLLTERMGRSFVAKDGSKVVGLILNELGTDSEVQYKHLGPQFVLIGELFGMMSENYFKQFKFQPKQIFNMLIAACQRQYSNRGILNQLILQSLQYAKQIGCKVALSELTSPITQHVFVNKFGFKIQMQYRCNDMKGSLSALHGCQTQKIILVHKIWQQN